MSGSTSIFFHESIVMPAMAQDITLWITGIGVLVLFFVSIRLSFTKRSILPVLLVISGFLTIANEPLIDLIGHVYHPDIGQITLFTSYERAIPVHVAFVLTLYYGGMYIYMLPRLAENNFNSSYLWKLFGITVILSYLVEVIPVGVTGLWVYDGYQPLWPWKKTLPLHWAVANSVSVFVPLAIIKHLYPKLCGWRLILVPLISPMGQLAAHLGATVPFYFIKNSPLGETPIWSELSGITSIVLAILSASLAIESLTSKPEAIDVIP